MIRPELHSKEDPFKLEKFNGFNFSGEGYFALTEKDR